ncbi:MAG: carboxypeptidase M32 [Flavobacteriales bacterium]|nr:carboxypeptidase M32 [Flavobacteriales bacterium]
MSNRKYERFCELNRKIAVLSSAAGLLSWDQETHMPPKGAIIKAEQMGVLSGIIHNLKTDKELVGLTEELLHDSSLDDVARTNVYEFNRTLQKSLQLSTEFVEELNRTISAAYPAWHQAKTYSRFELFAPHLERLIELKKQEIQLTGYQLHPYDALMDDFEPGLTTHEVDRLFDDVRKELVPFVQTITKHSSPDDSFFNQPYDENLQVAFGRTVLEAMGYDFSSGRMDRTEHPFCIGLHPGDVRVTYKIKPHDISEIIWGLIHEGGHALYEQGLPADQFGLASGSAASLSIHESQSRFWENNIGRSSAFWNFFFPKLQLTFPEQLKHIHANDFYKAANRVTPSLIRIQADELTYHFHIMIRYEIEKSIFEGKLTVNDLPGFWNKLYKEYLGLDVPNDAQGILQDVHWCHGGFGYFPTYSLGSFYAAQFYYAMNKELNTEELIEKGNLIPILDWLRTNIHQHGMKHRAQQLCEKVTGEKLNFAYFMQYAHKKYNSIYHINN